jgi:hypothetical protein
MKSLKVPFQQQEISMKSSISIVVIIGLFVLEIIRDEKVSGQKRKRQRQIKIQNQHVEGFDFNKVIT